MMEFIKYTIIIILTFIFQSWSAEFFTLGTIDPDFCVIVLLYISIKNGGMVGTLFGFFIGLFIDLSSGTNQFFGLTPLVYTMTGYFSSFLKEENQRPVFRYDLESVTISEAPEPVIQPGGTILKRSFSLEASSAAKGLYFLAGEGEDIEQIAPNHFKVGEAYEVKLKGSFLIRPILRQNGAVKQILIPVNLEQGSATLEQTIEW